MSRDEMKLRGTHNVENALAAFAAGLACGASPDSLREPFETSAGRTSPERSAEISGVRLSTIQSDQCRCHSQAAVLPETAARLC